MVKIPQHGPDKRLFDIASFLEDLDANFLIEEWEIEVPWCLERGSVEREFPHSVMRDPEFRNAYRQVYQTVDGRFILRSRGSVVAEFLAVDSSFWEIASTPAFEASMQAKYGKYYPA
jgi:hypothetical protein